MANLNIKSSAHTKTIRAHLPAKTSVGAAVFFALYGIPHTARSQQQGESAAIALEEVTVTANRRQQTLEEVPYSLSVISGEELAREGVTDITSLQNEVPGLSIVGASKGTRTAGEQSPVIRGINASLLGPISFQQNAVGTYFGNSPIDGYFQLDDIQHIEVLRGPQGTLYGAGALGGALRIIPNAPKMDALSGHIEVSGGSLAHSSVPSYAVSGVLNVPIGDTLAFRIAGKYNYQPGFIDVYGILERNGSKPTDPPLLVDPADPLTSPPVITSKQNWNFQNTFTSRASLLWKPVDKFSAEFAFVYSKVNGDGGSGVNPNFPGGTYYLDPQIGFPAGGKYREFAASDIPYNRTTNLTSLDLSYDVGFATLSATSSYQTTQGSSYFDFTYPYFPAGSPFLAYYAGNPTNPRFVLPGLVADTQRKFTQEVRLVSTSGPDNLFDYVIGMFYEEHRHEGSYSYGNPGSPEYSVAQGCTAPYFSGATFPNCLVIAGPNDIDFAQVDTQHFRDKSVFAELTWHVTKHGQITFGGRHFDGEFTDSQSYVDYTFPTVIPAVPNSSPASKNIWKVNPSYEYATDQYFYALWSQGFRRGGANALPLNGPFKESPVLETYAPDTTNNYETGLKGRFANGLRYTVDVFDIRWDKPQIASETPIGNLVVYNANKAEVKGVEFEVSGPLFVPGLRFSAGGSYQNAKLTESYSLPANDGGGTIEPGLISGTAGSPLPFSAKTSAVMTIVYDCNLSPGYDLSVSLNETYLGRIPLALVAPSESATSSQPQNIANFFAALNHNPWRFIGYITNIADKRLVLAANGESGFAGAEDINRPREVGMRIGYSF